MEHDIDTKLQPTGNGKKKLCTNVYSLCNTWESLSTQFFCEMKLKEILESNDLMMLVFQKWRFILSQLEPDADYISHSLEGKKKHELAGSLFISLT